MVNSKYKKIILVISSLLVLLAISFAIYNVVVKADFDSDKIAIKTVSITSIDTGENDFDNDGLDYNDPSSYSKIDGYIPGSDSKINNRIVRSFDKLIYHFNYSITGKQPGSDFEERKVTIKVTLSDENAKYVTFDENTPSGEKIHVYTFDGIDSYGSYQTDITLFVLGAPNGMTINPKFEIQESTNTDSNYIINLGSISFDNDLYNYEYNSEKTNKYNTKSSISGFTNYMPTIVSSKTAQVRFDLLKQEEGQKATYNNSLGRYLTYVFGLEILGDESKGIKGYTMPNGESFSFNINAIQDSTDNVIVENEWARLYSTNSVLGIESVIVSLPYSASNTDSRKIINNPGNISLFKSEGNNYEATINDYNITYKSVSNNADDSKIVNSKHFIGTYAISVFSPRNILDGKNDINTTLTINSASLKDTMGNNITIPSVTETITNKYYEVVDYSLTGEFYNLSNSKLSNEKGLGSTSKGSEIIFKTTFNYKKTLSNQGLKEIIKIDPNAFRVIKNGNSDIKISIDSDDNSLSEDDFEVYFLTGEFNNNNYISVPPSSRLNSEDLSIVQYSCNTVLKELNTYNLDQIMNLYAGPCISSKENIETRYTKISDANENGKEVPITKVVVQTKEGVNLPDSVKVVVDVKLRVKNVSDLTRTYQVASVATSSDYDSKLTYYSPRVTNDENSITNANNYRKTIYSGNEYTQLDTDSPYADSLRIVNFTSREEVTVTNKNTDGSVKINYNVSNSDTINYNIKTIIYDDNEKVGADDVWYINNLKVYVTIPNGLVYIEDKKLGNPEVINYYDGSTILIYTFPYTKPNMKIQDINFKAMLSPKIQGSSVPLTVTSTVQAININNEKDDSYFGNLIGSFTIYANGIQNVIVSQKVGDKGSVVEKDSEFSYLLNTYNNTTNDINDYTIMNILPSNGDKNGSSFKGSYKVKVTLPSSLEGATITCSNQAYNKLYNEVNNSLNQFEECDVLNNYISATAIKIDNISVKANSYIDDIKISIKPSNNDYDDKYINSFIGASKTYSQVESNKIDVRVINRSISGKVFIDTDEDGIEDDNDTYLENVPISIYKLDSGNNVSKIDETITNKNGEYKFSNLDVGRYKIRANYDSTLYDLTLRYATSDTIHDSDAYKIDENIAEISNKRTPSESDGIKVTREIEKVENMNIGLVSRKTFGFSISKYITKIDLTYNNITNTINYNNQNKVLLNVRNSLNATARVYYGIKITNNSTQAGYVKLINENIPIGLSFNSSDEYNKDWFSSNGSVQSISLENDLINPGESRYLKIVLDMPTQQEAKTFINEATIVDIQQYEPEEEAEDTNSNSNLYVVGEAVTYSGINWHVANVQNIGENDQILTLLADSGTISQEMKHVNSSNDIYKWSESKIKTYINSYLVDKSTLNLSALYDNNICDDASGLPVASYGGTLQNEGLCQSQIYKSYKIRLLTEKEFNEIMANDLTDKSWLNVTNEFWLMNSVYEQQQYDPYGKIIESTNVKNMAKYVSNSAVVQSANANTAKEVRPVITISNKNIILE